MTVLLAGATGLVGGQVLDRLIAAKLPVVAVGRRDCGRVSPDLREILIEFAAMPELPQADLAICALGTTIRAAGSQTAFRAVDHAAVLAFATAARAAGAGHFILISSVGAHADSPVFYSRVKGEAERDVAALGFARFDILQPGLILGERAERRPAEAVFQRLAPMFNRLLWRGADRYGAIEATIIADAVLALCRMKQAGRFIQQNRDMRILSRPR